MVWGGGRGWGGGVGGGRGEEWEGREGWDKMRLEVCCGQQKTM